MYDCILVPTDGSQEVERALEYAFDLADAHDATIRALYVVNVAGYGGLPMETALEGVSDALREEGQAAVGRVEDLAPAEITVETAVREGAPSQVIINEADPTECDLVVMGTHGRGGIDRLLLGSVTERVVRRSSVPVLTVQVDPDEIDERAEAPPLAAE
ncbi:universal stress protein [Natrinema versiforme]|uniref:UspA domain-containing protein n=1 Tax=Natrinema versiforme JCM 10478 TaxID=1227496 RepID=L9Y0S8_9EURY|nr:universal stress protein [Natrinema versiforme]ELY67635.1 UspA domain-containing protein [Natrinema versiforme JCM 10478]